MSKATLSLYNDGMKQVFCFVFNSGVGKVFFFVCLCIFHGKGK